MKAELCVALDGSDRNWIIDTAAQLDPEVDWLKIGLEAFTAHGPELIRAVTEHGAKVFLDLKLHDIPNTVARAAANCVRSGAAIVNVHAGGGGAMMRAAVEAVRQSDPEGTTKVIAVTLLTSLDGDELSELGIEAQPRDLVLRWAQLAQDCGLDGVVASAQEAKEIRRICGPDFLIVTPGIRPHWAAGNDQRRTLGPADAAASGSDILVVGRPITTAGDPVAAARRIMAEIG
ncbi:MAG: orotidine-5'-phosphate decarboxylase [Thermoanaerobaculales bacterium]|nr:orotidine-5'-phosphate decarboxylase [Thermoanaerobaculales bacterium]